MAVPQAPAGDEKPIKKRGGARPGSGPKPRVDRKAIAAAKAAVAKGLDARTAAVVADETAKAEAENSLTLTEVPLALTVVQARKRIGVRYPLILDDLFTLAHGGTQIVRKYEIAGLVTVDAWGDPDENGRQAKIKQPLFPDKKPDEMILLSITETVLPPDAAIGMFLFNRLAGKPAEEKTNPLDDSSTGLTEQPPTREELLEELFGMMLSRWEAKQQVKPPAPRAALEAALTGVTVTEDPA